MKPLSEKQQQILAFIEQFSAREGYSPSVREICAAVGLRSPSTVHAHLRVLTERGLLNRGDAGKKRTLTLPGESVVRVPILGNVAAGAPILAEENIEGYRFREALKEAMNLARLGNKYLADTEPWKVVKTDPERVKTILNIALQITAELSIAIEPFMPFSAAKIIKMLNIEKLDWERLGEPEVLPAGHVIGKAELLFEKIEDSVVEAQVAKLQATKAANEAAEKTAEPQKAECSFDDFQKMDIRVSTILEAEKLPKTKKLLKLTIDTGIDKRTIVSGIAEHFKPEELIGKQVLVLVNLAPREMKGVMSQGMILMAEDASGKLELLSPEHKTNNGAIVG